MPGESKFRIGVLGSGKGSNFAAIADAVARVWRDDRLRDRLATDGRARASLFTWDRSARVFRAAYRELGGLELSDHDRALLDAEPIV